MLQSRPVHDAGGIADADCVNAEHAPHAAAAAATGTAYMQVCIAAGLV
jgi:hypothetical protein